MWEKAASKLTYANVLSTIAVLSILGTGSAYAAAQIGAGDIKRNAVRSKH
jgi:Flp pilus assembly protein protease CpaA